MEDLGLSLSLSSSVQGHHRKACTSWAHLFSSAERGTTYLMGIDVNQAPAAGREADQEEEDAGGASSPNSTLSSVGGKRGHGGSPRSEHITMHEQPERASSRGAGAGGNTSDEDDGGEYSAGGSTRKKLRLSKDQSAVLEESFKEHNTLNPKQKMGLAKQLGLKPRQVEVWFQNRRARTKLKQTEVDCEYLKRCCETLSQENRRLHKEVQELRALKLLPPHLFLRMPPPTTLTLCPSCERLSSSGSASSSAPANCNASAPWPPVVPFRQPPPDGPSQPRS